MVSKKSAKVCKVKFISLQLRSWTPKGAGVSIFKSKSQWWRKSLNLSQRNIISSQGNANVFLRLSGLRSPQLTKVECMLRHSDNALKFNLLLSLLGGELLHEVNNSGSSFPWRATWSETLGAVGAFWLADDRHLINRESVKRVV